MSDDIRIRLIAGPRALAWATPLAAEWTLAGAAVDLRAASSGEDWLVRLVLYSGENLVAEDRLYLDHRKTDTARRYLCFEVLGEQIRAGDEVDFEDMFDKEERYESDWYEADSKVRKENSWTTTTTWLESRRPLWVTILLNHVAEVYSPNLVTSSPAMEESVLLPEGGSPPWLQRVEARRLLVQARYQITQAVELDEALAYLREAAKLAKALEDPCLATQVEALRAAEVIEDHRYPFEAKSELDKAGVEKGFVRLDRAWRRAQKLGDLPGVLAIARLIAFERSWEKNDEGALEVLEKTTLYAAKHGGFVPPQWEPLLLAYRAIVAPSEATLLPLFEEWFDLLEGGWTSWMDSLDYLGRVQKKVGKERFTELIVPFVGEKNAENMVRELYFGPDEDWEREDRDRVVKDRLERDRQRPAFRDYPYLFANG